MCPSRSSRFRILGWGGGTHGARPACVPLGRSLACCAVTTSWKEEEKAEEEEEEEEEKEEEEKKQEADKGRTTSSPPTHWKQLVPPGVDVLDSIPLHT